VFGHDHILMLTPAFHAAMTRTGSTAVLAKKPDLGRVLREIAPGFYLAARAGSVATHGQRRRPLGTGSPRSRRLLRQAGGSIASAVIAGARWRASTAPGDREAAKSGPRPRQGAAGNPMRASIGLGKRSRPGPRPRQGTAGGRSQVLDAADGTSTLRAGPRSARH
jgi:hypothetical protein